MNWIHGDILDLGLNLAWTFTTLWVSSGENSIKSNQIKVNKNEQNEKLLEQPQRQAHGGKKEAGGRGESRGRAMIGPRPTSRELAHKHGRPAPVFFCLYAGQNDVV